MDMDYTGQGNHPDVVAAVQKVVDACKKANIASGNHIASIEHLRYWMEQGMRMITYAAPPVFIIDRGQEAIKSLKEGIVD